MAIDIALSWVLWLDVKKYCDYKTLIFFATRENNFLSFERKLFFCPYTIDAVLSGRMRD
jgi:hypothetical protein